MSDRTRSRQIGRLGFTLMELLIVIVIIVLLIAISLAVGSKVLSTGKESLTTNVIRSLDSALATYIASAADKIPEPLVLHPDSPASTPFWQPVADARKGSSAEMINSVGWFIYQVKDVSDVSRSITGLPAQVVREYSPAAINASGDTQEAYGQPMLPTVFDGWGNPIRYVHPTFDGVITSGGGNANPEQLSKLIKIDSGERFAFNQLRRNAVAAKNGEKADSDGGYCPGGRPYFYSVGADDDPGTTNDNIYTTRPQFSTE